MKIWKGQINKDCYFATQLDVDALRHWARENEVKMIIQLIDTAGYAYKIRISEGEELFVLRWL